MKNIFRKVMNIIKYIIIFNCLFLTLLILHTNSKGYIQIKDLAFIDISESILNSVNNNFVGDLVVVKETDDVKIGDVVYYFEKSNDNYFIADGSIVKTFTDNGRVIYQLLSKEDKYKNVYNIFGKRIYTVHKIGSFVSFIKSKFGFFIIVIFPLIFILVFSIYSIFFEIKSEALEKKYISNINDEKELI